MDKLFTILKLGAYWYNRPLSGSEYINTIKLFFNKMKNVDPLFNRIFLSGLGTGDYVRINESFDNLESELVSALASHSSDNERILYLDENNSATEFSMSARSVLGFYNDFVSSVSSEDLRLSISMKIGALQSDIANSLVLHLHDDFCSEYDRMLKILKEIVLFWNPYDANLSKSIYDLKTGQRAGDVRVGWATYLSDKSISSHIPKEYICENFSSGIIVRLLEPPIEKNEDNIINNIKNFLQLLKSINHLKVKY